MHTPRFTHTDYGTHTCHCSCGDALFAFSAADVALWWLEHMAATGSLAALVTA